MKTKTKRILWLSFFLIFAGGLIVLFGFVGVNFDIYALDDTEYNAHKISAISEGYENIDSELTKIVLDIPSTDIFIVSGEEFSLNYYLSEYSVVEDGFSEEGVFSFKLREVRPWHKYVGSFVGFKRDLYPFTLSVPNDVDIQVVGGDTRFAADSTFGNINISADNASVDFENVSAGNVEIDAGNGKINIKNSAFESLTADIRNARATLDDGSYGNVNMTATNSRVELKNNAAVEAFELKGSNNRLVFNDTVISNFFKADGSNNRADLCKVTIANGVEITGSNVSFTFELCAFEELGVNSSNGRFVLESCDVNKINALGNNLYFRADSVSASEYDFAGNNMTVRVTHKGSKSDFSSILISGSNSSARVDGDSMNGSGNKLIKGSGDKIFNIIGNNVNVRLNFEV